MISWTACKIHLTCNITTDKPSKIIVSIEQALYNLYSEETPCLCTSKSYSTDPLNSDYKYELTAVQINIHRAYHAKA